jgi:hypothetical protein
LLEFAAIREVAPSSMAAVQHGFAFKRRARRGQKSGNQSQKLEERGEEIDGTEGRWGCQESCAAQDHIRPPAEGTDLAVVGRRYRGRDPVGRGLRS